MVVANSKKQKPNTWGCWYPFLWVLAAGVSLLAVDQVTAQRVQIPASSPSNFSTPNYASSTPAWGNPAGNLPASPVYTPGVSAPTFNPYGTAANAGGVPPAALPYNYTAPQLVSPAYAQPLSSGTPVYGSPNYTAPSLSSSPYGSPMVSGAPAYSYNAPPASNGFMSEGNPLGWQAGTYGFEQSDGTTTTWRRLVSRIRGEHTLLLGDNSADAFEVNRLEIASTLAFPIAGTIDDPLLVSPGFAFNWLGGPEGDPAGIPRGPDLPAQVYDAYVDFAWYPRFNPSLGAELGFRTGVWTDFDELNSDSMRYLGRALGVVTMAPQFELLFGVVYLDRLRVKTLPAGGVRWRPTPEWDLYMVFPNPKIRRTLSTAGGADWWWYVGGEYGGGSWTIDRAGTGDRIDYNDIRISMGLEWQTPTQFRGHAEVGYAFDREILFGDTNDPSRFKPDDAVMFRIGLGY